MIRDAAQDSIETEFGPIMTWILKKAGVLL
jgi:hypothetical protein